MLVSLAAYGANFDIVDDQGNNPLHYAASGGHAMCCKFLAQRGNHIIKNIINIIKHIHCQMDVFLMWYVFRCGITFG